MSNILIGTIQNMSVQEVQEEYYILANDTGQATLKKTEDLEDLAIGASLDVFIYPNKQGKLMASHSLPTARLGVFGWGEVIEVLPHLGAFIHIGTAIDVLVSLDDLPLVQAAWPAEGDKLYVRLKKDKKDRLLAVPATENEFNDVFIFAETEKVDLNNAVSGHVIRPGREGSVIITEERYRGFIHHTEREKEPRFGQYVSGRVIEVKEDGSLNVSLLPLKHERMDDDAAKILQYIEENGGSIPFGNKSDPEEIRETFHMSKSAFKRALGRLMKEGKVKQEDGFTTLL